MPSVVENLSRAVVEKLSADRHEPAWLREKRLAGWEAYEQLPTPDWTRGIRGWWSGVLKYTSFEELQPFTPAGKNLPNFNLTPAGEAAPSGVAVQYNSEIVRVELSAQAKAAGVILCSLEEAVKSHPELVRDYFMTRCVPVDEHRLTALHAALWTGGVFLYVPDNTVLDTPFRAVFYHDQPGAAFFTHTLVVTGKNCKIQWVEEHHSNGTAADRWSLDSNATEIFVGDGSKVEYIDPQEYGENVTNISTKRALIGSNGVHNWVVANLGSDVTRLTLESWLVGSGSHAETTGVSFSSHKQNFDVQFRSLHRVSHTTANSIFKQVLDDQSSFGFRGAIRTEKNAQHTDSFLQDHTLYLSQDSKADVLPSLDVDANDVRCSHGATIGMIDKDQVFYLMSRGLDRTQAEEMIVAGYFEEVIERIPLESMRERLRESIQQKIYE